MQAWGKVLGHPGLGLVGESCRELERAALIMAADQRNITGAYHALAACTDMLAPILASAPPPGALTRTAQGYSSQVHSGATVHITTHLYSNCSTAFCFTTRATIAT